MNDLQAFLDVALSLVWTICMCVIIYRIKVLEKKMDEYFGYDGEEYVDKEEEDVDEELNEDDYDKYFSTLNADHLDDGFDEEVHIGITKLASIDNEVYREEIAL